MKTIIPLLFLVLSNYISFAQSTPDAKVFEAEEFIWCGLDYSKLKCIGYDGFADPYDIKNRYFASWNMLMLAEREKYNFQHAYQKSHQFEDLSVVNRRNDLPDPDELVINEAYSLKENDIKEIISDYDLQNTKEGLGLVYIVESLSKVKSEAVINVVFFDIATKEVLWSKKYSNYPRGFEFRNFWAKPIHATIIRSGKDYEYAMKSYLKSQKN